MAVTIPTTRAEALTQYQTNLAYDLNGSITECDLFIVACRWLLKNPITRTDKDGESAEIDLKLTEAQLKQAMAWRAANVNAISSSGAPRTSYVDLRGFRT